MTTNETSLKPVQVDNLIKETIDASMRGNEGLAIIKLRKYFPSAPEMIALNNRLISIELEARKEMMEAICDFLFPELLPCK